MSQRRTEIITLPLPDGGALAGRASFAGTPGANAVLFVHGFGSSHRGEKSEAVEAVCARRGWTFAAFSFRGHADSSGGLSELRGAGLQDDLDRIADHLASLGTSRLFLVGSSMGGWASAWFARRHPAKVVACAVIAPAFDFLGRRWQLLSEADRAAWRDTGRLRVRNQWLDVDIGYGLAEERDAFRVEQLAQDWRTPLVIFQGMNDDTVPYSESLSFVERVNCPDVELRLYRHGDHRLLPFKDEIAEAACAFFERHGFRGGPVT